MWPRGEDGIGRLLLWWSDSRDFYLCRLLLYKRDDDYEVFGREDRDVRRVVSLWETFRFARCVCVFFLFFFFGFFFSNFLALIALVLYKEKRGENEVDKVRVEAGMLFAGSGVARNLLTGKNN